MSLTAYKKVMQNYFPLTNKCGYDGKECQKTECSLWLGENKCWQIEFNELCLKHFGEVDSLYIKAEDDCWNPCFQALRIHGRGEKDKKNSFKVVLYLYFNGHRLAEKVRNKFELEDWKLVSGYEEAYNLVLTFEGNPHQKEEIINNIKKIKDLIPSIVAFEKEINTCQLCKNKADVLEEYMKYSICFNCKEKIIKENINKYF